MPAARRCCKSLIIAAIALVLFACEVAVAQPPGMIIQGQPFRGGRPPGMVMPPGAQPGQPPSGEAKPDEKKDEEKKKDEDKEKKDEEKKDETVKRPNEPPKPADPRELQAKPDATGRITFSFNGQPWADVLQWLANVSELSLDWRELPSDYLNLTTQRSYTLAEARDLINRHLQARGYALLLSGEVLSVVKLDAVDPSLVPRATEEDLYDLLPHDLVKLSIELPEGLDVTKAVEDVKQALSPHAKVMPLAATKRLLLIDTVANLRMVSALLNSERLAAEGRVVPREFVLKYIQASAVIDTLYVVLGLDPNSRPSQMELQMQQQKMQLMQQMAQSGKDVMQMLKKDGPPVYLAYNRQRNSVLVNAPEAEMRVIERTIKALDIPAGGVPGGDDEMPMVRTLEQYRLKTITPDAVITTLEEIGNLSPRSELRGDKDSKTIFARASEVDHEKIKELISQLDGSETMVEVFWLRRLPAEAVAGSIQSLIIEKPKKKESNNDYPFYIFGGRRNQEPEEPDTILRVDADIENNRLIVRGTPQQLDEVRDLLVKLGEPIGEGGGDNRRVRMFDALDPAETQRLLEQIKEAWPAIGGDTELVIPPAPQADAPADKDVEEDDVDKEPTRGTVASKTTESPFRLLATTTVGESEVNEAAEAQPAEAPTTEAQPAKPKSPPINIQIDQRGRIVIASDDTAALDRLQELVTDLAPEPAKYEVFHVKNRTPDDIVFNLETYFKDFLAEDDDDSDLNWWERMRGGQDKEAEPVKLSRRQPLRFLADDWSSSILVANATAAQLEEMERLIESWDRQPVNDRILTRRTATVKLRYAKASVVVSALKDVYRDLLSKGDREFDTEESKASGTSLRYLTRIQHQEGDATEPTGIPFGGVLSLGSDDAANVVILSARSEVFDSVLETIDDLDQQARPTTTVKVVQLEGGLASDALRQALARALTAQGAAPPEAGNNNNRDRRGGGGDRRGGDRWRGRERGGRGGR